jgi:hypothetical protein
MPSAYLNVEKLKEEGGELILTIKSVVKENVAPEDKPEDRKWVVYFHGTEMGVVLNSTRLAQLSSIFDSNDSDVWQGKAVHIYVDPNVSFAGRRVGGVAFKAVTGKRESPPKPSDAPSSHGASVSIQDSPALWTQPDEYEGLLLSQVPTDYLQTWLQTYPQADINLRKAVKRDLAERDE